MPGCDLPRVAATLIELFEVPPSADDAFLADWRRERADLAATLHRALRDDVPLRFVGVARVDSPEEFGSPLYELVHEDGAPEGAGGVVQISPFEVPPDADDRFLAAWQRLQSVLATRRGYLGTRLYRSLAPADFRFVSIARWSSPLMVQRTAQTPEFQQAAADLPFPSHAALYRVVAG
jgi:heme-degrading monooxygenase HmoA